MDDFMSTGVSVANIFWLESLTVILIKLVARVLKIVNWTVCLLNFTFVFYDSLLSLKKLKRGTFVAHAAMVTSKWSINVDAYTVTIFWSVTIQSVSYLSLCLKPQPSTENAAATNPNDDAQQRLNCVFVWALSPPIYDTIRLGYSYYTYYPFSKKQIIFF